MGATHNSVLCRVTEGRTWAHLSSWCIIACFTFSCGNAAEYRTVLRSMEMDYSIFEEECGRQHPGVPGYLSALRDGVLYATQSRHLGAYDLRNGSELWRFKDPDFCVREFVPLEGRVVLIQTREPYQPRQYPNSIFLDYFVVALDSETGVVLWRNELPGDVVPGSLAVQGDSIYLAGQWLWSQLINDVRGDEIPQIYAVDLESGSTRWSSPLQSLRSAREYNPISTVTLVPDEGGVLVHKTAIYGSWDAEFFESGTGMRRWAFPVRARKGKTNPHSRVGPIANGRFPIFRNQTAGVYSMDVYSLQTGEKLASIVGEWGEWSPHCGSRHFDNQIMYQYCLGTLSAFDLETGKPIWTSELGIERGVKGNTRGYRAIDLQGGVISVGADDGFIYLVNAKDGEIRGRG